MYDVAVIGAGITGANIARELSRYNLKICILEKEEDVSMGATKANSGIIHAGFDAKPDTLKAKLNVEGAGMIPKIAEELSLSYKQTGALVVAYTEEEEKVLSELLERGRRNKVSDLEILSRKELEEKEPNISKEARAALYAPSSGIICPYEFCIAAIGNAMDNGAELIRNFRVDKVLKICGGYQIFSGEKRIEAKFAVNATGVYADKTAELFGDNSFKITPRKGEYILFDKEFSGLVSHTIFRTPTKMGKGILISPTVDGNILAGPTAEDIEDKDDKNTTKNGLSVIMKEAEKNLKEISFKGSVTSFAGLRATGSTGDFIINKGAPRFVNAAAIESPGLTASPAIAKMVVKLLADQGLELSLNTGFNPKREGVYTFKNASPEEKNEIIKKDKRYGRIICRCEEITEGEIVAAIRRNPTPADTDGVKRRTRVQMGRCQGGFCTPGIIKILADELNISPTGLTKQGGESIILSGKTKEEF